ncbi:unnamed protein product [Rotaria socialis]|uniref:SUEL-type lectin domain-containing protein n=3 Tax=Rotaria socialis TaxID=392032 RepID=A0A820JFR5_9BILA|nr:unnamed protein product [Rotaria socialis]
MVLLMFHRQLLLLFSIFHTTFANVETLHFESACLQQSISVHLNLRCSQYEHIKIIRVIYGYTKQPLFQDCQFSIYDCIQEGTSHNILSCNDQQTCVINLTKSEMLSTAVTTNGVPNCPDFNYIQVNYGCIPDSKDICDQWKDEGPTVHISHTYAKERQFNRCHCKVRSSMPNGQVLLHAREINRQFGSLKSLLLPKSSNNDCKKTTYLEIATDRSERKCMDMLPSTSNSALFGSGSHNFTLTYVKNDLYSELFFYFELKASPIKKDHNVQIICNWKRHSTTTITTTLTTSIITSTIPIKRSRKRTTVEMQNGGKLSRADLIRRRPVNQKIPNDDYMNVEDTTNVLINEDQEEIVQQQDEVEEQEQEEEEEISTTTTMVTTTIKQSKIKKKKTSGSSTVTTRTTTTTTTKLSDDDEEWLRMLSLAADVGSQAPSKQLLSINNRTFVTLTQASIINSDEKLRQTLPKSNTLLFILLIIICVTIFVLIAYCFKVKRPGFMKRLRTNANIAFLFCCEAAKLIFCSSNEARRQSISISNTPNTAIENRSSRRHHHGRNRPSSTLPDYQSSEYYMDEKINDCGTTQNSTSQDSLLNGEHNEYRSNIQNASQNERPPSTTNSKISSKMSTTKSTTNGKLTERKAGGLLFYVIIKQKKEEAEILRLQKFQEQLRKKEQKWQQQQVERVKKWLQLRNRDGDHRLQVEERRRKREEEARAKIDEILRREKEREQNYQQRVNHNQKTNVVIRPDSAMSVSTDVVSTRRAVSASRIRSNHQDIPNQRAFNDSTDDNSTVVISSHQLNPIDEQPNHDRSTTHESFVSATHHSSARSQTRPMTTSNVYWLNTGDNTTTTTNNNNNKSANFMRLTYAANCRSNHSHSADRCPRALIARDETANRESPQRMPNSNRHHNNDVINRLAKPKIAAMTQSVHVSTATAASSLNGLPVSRSSHQLRLTASSNGRRQIHTRPATVPTSNNESRTSPSDESSRVEHHLSNKQSTNRPTTHSKPSSNTSKPPMASAFSRSKPSTQRSQMTISNSSSSLSSSTIPHKRLIGAASPAKSKPPPSSSSPQPTSTTITTEIQPITNTSEEEIVPVNQEVMSTIESITNDTNDDKVNLIKSEQEQKYIDEQEYQRKLNQKIREAQQRLEIERQREEERQRQLELEEYEREQEQIRLVEEQRRVEQERLQRAIEERVRENELKRQEELRIQQQREELERKQAEETERLNRERQERARKEEEERIERKRRLDLIMRRTRQVSPTAKPENNINKPTIEQTNGHDQINNISSPIAMIKSSIPHSMSDNRFPTSSSTEHFLLNNDSNTLSTLSSTTDTPKFKSPLIQSLLNKARNTRSTDNLSQTSMTASQIMIESMVDESANATKSTTPTDLSDEYHNENSTITITSNGHSDLHLSSSNNLNSFHDRPMEAATAFQ